MERARSCRFDKRTITSVAKAQREAAAARKKWEEENPDIVAEENVKAIESTGCRVGDEVIFGHFRRILSATPQVCEDTRCLLKVF